MHFDTNPLSPLDVRLVHPLSKKHLVHPVHLICSARWLDAKGSAPCSSWSLAWLICKELRVQPQSNPHAAQRLGRLATSKLKIDEQVASVKKSVQITRIVVQLFFFKRTAKFLPYFNFLLIIHVIFLWCSTPYLTKVQPYKFWVLDGKLGFHRHYSNLTILVCSTLVLYEFSIYPIINETGDCSSIWIGNGKRKQLW